MSQGATKAGSSWHLLTKSDYVTGRCLPQQAVAGSRAEEDSLASGKRRRPEGAKERALSQCVTHTCWRGAKNSHLHEASKSL